MEENDLVFGIRAMQEALEVDKSFEKVYLQMGIQGVNIQKIISLLKERGIPFSYVPVEKLNTLTKFQNHQGIVAKTAHIKYWELADLAEKILVNEDKPLFLLLDHITDVRNFGAIIRTAECAGVHGIIVPKTGSATLNSVSIKTSAGAAFRIPICKVDHLKDAIYYLQSNDIKIVAATEKTERNIYELDFNTSLAIILGSEEIGINPSILKIVDFKAKLPLLGKIDSLNVSVACGAILYEVVRQRM